MGRAKHRRRQTAAQCHLRLEFLKRFGIQPPRTGLKASSAICFDDPWDGCELIQEKNAS
jgi:hypothetical protein